MKFFIVVAAISAIVLCGVECGGDGRRGKFQRRRWNDDHDWSRSDSHECICPSAVPTADFNNATQSLSTLLTTVQALWNSAEPPMKTASQQRMKKAILDMAASDSSKWQQYSLSMSLWLWSNLGQYKTKPSLCAFATMINATEEYQKTKNLTVVFDALDKTGTFLGLSAERMVQTAITNSGCKCHDDKNTQTTPALTCYKDGTVYPFKDAWYRRGGEFPCDLTSSSLTMYNSNDWVEQAMAAAATTTLSEFQSAMVPMFDKKVMFEFFNFQTLGKIPRCCCREFIKRANELSQMNQKGSTVIIQAIKDKLSPPTTTSTTTTTTSTTTTTTTTTTKKPPTTCSTTKKPSTICSTTKKPTTTTTCKSIV